jgi:hypothetical protein
LQLATRENFLDCSSRAWVTERYGPGVTSEFQGFSR